jgi:hypothetical protein
MSIRIVGVRPEGGRCALTGERCGELLAVRDDSAGGAELLVSAPALAEMARRRALRAAREAGRLAGGGRR